MNLYPQLIETINSYSRDRIPFLLIVDFEMSHPVCYRTDELQTAGILFQFSTPDEKTAAGPIVFDNIEPISVNEYKRGFDVVMKHLLYGNSYLTNLTAKTEISTKSSLADIYHAAAAPYKILFKDQWVCFSPECFIKIQDGEILSYPMKGTIDADLPDAQRILRDDEKEIAEHFTIVDLIRNDLSMVAEQVKVASFRYFEKIKSNHKNLLQASSKIKGRLPFDFRERLGEILFTLLPAGSVSGAPKKKTLEIIAASENGKRGYYTGVAFFFDGTNVDSCVLIRFIEKEGEQLYYRSGGGITINSEMEKEYQELKDKIYVPVY